MPFPTPHILPPAEYLRACFHLDIETGALFWKERPPHHFPCFCYQRRFAFRVGGRADILATGGYRRLRLSVDGKGKMYGAHRIIWKLVHGTEPGPELDHINGDPGDNRPCNLREVTRSENMLNARRLSAHRKEKV